MLGKTWKKKAAEIYKSFKDAYDKYVLLYVQITSSLKEFKEDQEEDDDNLSFKRSLTNQQFTKNF